MTYISNVLGKSYAIEILMEVHRNPGESQTFYAGTNKTKWAAIRHLVTSGLALIDEDPRQWNSHTVILTAEGEAIALLLSVIEHHLIKAGKS